jgi:hypothetical protein
MLRTESIELVIAARARLEVVREVAAIVREPAAFRRVLSN